MEGLTVLEYFISTHGARKGLADTALRTADSGYLTRRLVDVAQDVIIREPDCGTEGVHRAPRSSTTTGEPERRTSSAASPRPTIEDQARPRRSLEKGAGDRPRRAGRHRRVAPRGHEASTVTAIPVRSVLKCEAQTGVCQACYGRSMASGKTAQIGDAVGHHRRAVDRRARHAADHADVPHRRRRRRGHHARPAARRRAVRGAQAEGPGEDRRAGRHRRRSRRPTRRSPSSSPTTPARSTATRSRGARACSSTEGEKVDGGHAAQRGLAVPARPAGAPRPDRDRAVPRQGGAGGLQVPGRGHQRQAHRADRAPDAQEGPRRPEGRHGPTCPGQFVDRYEFAKVNARDQEEQGRDGAVRGDHPRHHQGLAEHGLVPVGGLLPGDDQGPDRRRARGQEGHASTG